MDNAGESLAKDYIVMYVIGAEDRGLTSSYYLMLVVNLYPALAVGFLTPYSLIIPLRTRWYRLNRFAPQLRS